MKRKFSFNLAPVKISAKPDASDKQAPEPTPSSHSQSSSQSHSHRKSHSKDSICDSSPYINRRVLDAQTERELRVSCRLILQNFKPSDHGMENTDPKLDFGGLQARKEPKEHKTQTSEVKVRMPTGAPAELTSAFARKTSTKTRTRAKADNEIRARTQGELPVRANSSRKRADFGWLDDRDDKREQNLKKFGRSPSIDLPRPAPIRADGDSGVSTPVTVSSTLAYSKSASTAPTSASVTSGKNSNRRSRQLENPAAVADAQAAEWMRQEVEKKRKEDISQPQARPSTAVRPPSRAASIKNNIKGYVFPGTRSRALSRAQSSESLRTADAVGTPTSPHDLQRSGSTKGWRNWGLHRSGSRSNSRPGTSRGQPDEPDRTKQPDPSMVNLNRELPPLPGLDTWKEPAEPQEEVAKSPKSPTSGTHIASLMRPQEQHQERSPAARKQHRRSGSDTLAMQYANVFPVRSSSRANPEAIAIPQPTRTAPTSPGPAITGFSSPSNLNNHLEAGSSTHTRERSGGSVTSPTSPNGKMSLEVPMNFSRKISMDEPSHSTFSNEVKLSRRADQKSRLKKIFTGWMTKKEKNDDWMHQLEKDGVKEGVLVQDGQNVAPVVRY
ncbi:hypothetical protein BKA66DRAFT_515161 [Pyrenochaeta sp. MPI-SDFR-AT-0127]|nr:hypothetical protein BKA66DRAFT_515161 [Pyrenochaeta sp. MPI-SDFR-AT-0127]